MIPFLPERAAACTTTPSGAGSATYNFNVPATANYRIWTRISAPVSGNGVFLKIDTACPVKLVNNFPANTWAWINLNNGDPALRMIRSFSAGNHTIRLIGNQANVKVDGIILTPNLTCVPSGTGSNCAGVSVTAPTNPYPCSTRPELRTGSSGVCVQRVQWFLNQKIQSNLVIDGDFGPLTTAAVKTFEQKQGLTVDGIVGSQTWGALEK